MMDVLPRRPGSSSPRRSSAARTSVTRPSPNSGIYLDYAATTPVDPIIARTMSDFLTLEGTFGNPASVTHAFGWAATEAVDRARQEVATLLSSKPEDIIWTSGATEAINLAMKGAALARCGRGGHIVTSPLEHMAVLDSAKWLESQGFEVSHVDVDEDGVITEDNLSRALRSDTILVSLMLVNNETGTITDIAALAPIARKNGALFHVDAVQGFARLPVSDIVVEADLISTSGHKIYGPKGIGALCVRGSLRSELVPQIHGGGHELGLRSGTLPTHQIVGMGEAAKIVSHRLTTDTKHIASLDRRLRRHTDQIAGVATNGSRQRRIPGILNLHFADVEAESLMLALGDVAISSGSACTSAEIQPSHVLLALGHGRSRALSSIRLSFGRFTTAEEIDRVGESLDRAVATLRRLAQ